MARSQTSVRPEGLEFKDTQGNKVTLVPAEGGGYAVFDHVTGKVIETVSRYKKTRSIKRNASGQVQFAGVDTDRGTTKTLTGVTGTTNMSATFDKTANFCKAILNYTTTATSPNGTLVLKIIQGTKTLASTSVATPTTDGALTITASNTIMTNPKALLSNNLTGATGSDFTLTAQLEDLVTHQIPLV